MKQLLVILFVLSLSSMTSQAQFSTLSKIYKGAKATMQVQKNRKQGLDEWGDKKVKDIHNDAQIDTISAEYKQMVAKAQQELYDSNPVVTKMMDLQGDSVALKKYMEEQFGGMSQEEVTRKVLQESGVDFDVQESYSNLQQMVGFTEDPVFKKIMAEQRQPTTEEATYLNEKYGTNIEYDGIETLNDSVGVFACLPSGMKPIGITKFETITDEKPIPDLGQDAVKQYVQDFIGVLKQPLADKEVVDSVQNYMIYSHRHADVQFNGAAKFTLYSNLEVDLQELKVNDFISRKITAFSEPIDPNNIFVFKVHKGIGCRYMEYMYSKISYKQSELRDYIVKRLAKEGYIDANINQILSDEELFKAIEKMEFQFKVEKLLKMRMNKDKFMFTNTIPAAKNVELTSCSRKIGHVTALDISINAEPGEYAFVIRNPEVEQYFKQMKEESNDKDFQNFDISVLTEGAFFFTIN